jgi:hypothetical protein
VCHERDGARYGRARRLRKPARLVDAQCDSTAEISLNAGGEMTGPHVRVLPGDIASWNPRTRRWRRGPRAPIQIGDARPAWSGQCMYVLAASRRLLAYGP